MQTMAQSHPGLNLVYQDQSFLHQLAANVVANCNEYKNPFSELLGIRWIGFFIEKNDGLLLKYSIHSSMPHRSQKVAILLSLTH